MVFQSYALYPHMTVEQNLAFGLRVRRVARAEIHERVHTVAKTLELDQLLQRKPAELSGGQRQRVALGRAIVREPKVFLFDEPLSNLDARLRTEMRSTIRRLYDRLRVTSVYVTHDQVEAMTIGDLLVVMNQGRIHQVGDPETCYRRPADTFVASFLGSPAMNFTDGEVADDAVAMQGGARLAVAAGVREALRARPQAAVRVGIRPEDIHAAPGMLAAPVALRATVALREPLGHETLTHLRGPGVSLVARGAQEFTAGPDGETDLFLDGTRVHIFWKDSGRRVDGAGVATGAGDAG
jgi:ABC-type sugar transport system ATPase subunit